ncbi:MAG: hypothetical protein IAI48_04125 [Candidatus Eremiobacteraeota bacterium]|jgi:hypothetical protein|nr:hypothetical protein [Candidatus Eremiobacteraeota bacterium]
MNDRNEDTGTSDVARTIEDKVRDHAQVLEKTFGLDSDTARITADDNVATGMRKPASDDVEAERIAAAKATS